MKSIGIATKRERIQEKKIVKYHMHKEHIFIRAAFFTVANHTYIVFTSYPGSKWETSIMESIKMHIPIHTHTHIYIDQMEMTHENRA